MVENRESGKVKVDNGDVATRPAIPGLVKVGTEEANG